MGKSCQSVRPKSRAHFVWEFTVTVGAQYRFMPHGTAVPYLGAGLDLFYNDFDPVPDESLYPLKECPTEKARIAGLFQHDGVMP